MKINPYTLVKNEIGFLLSMLIFKRFCAPWLTPKTFTTPVSMLAKRSGSDRKYRGINFLLST